MGKYRVNFKRRQAGQNSGDNKEYGIIVDADTLGSAEDKAVREIVAPHAKAFLTAEDITKIEQVA